MVGDKKNKIKTILDLSVTLTRVIQQIIFFGFIMKTTNWLDPVEVIEPDPVGDCTCLFPWYQVHLTVARMQSEDIIRPGCTD